MYPQGFAIIRHVWALASSSDNLHIEIFATQHRTVTHHMKERAFTLIQNKQPCIFSVFQALEYHI